MDEWFKDWFDKDYAAIYGHRDGAEAERAVAMARSLAPDLDHGPVLDLACGAGRHLAVLRWSNRLAFGVDLSRDLLAMSPAHLRPWLLRADMRRLPLRPGRLAGICLWFTPFGYFSDAENRALLASLRDLLRPGGVLVLDYLNAGFVLEHLVAEDEIWRGGLRVHSTRRLEGDRLVRRMVLADPAGGRTREALESVRLYRPEELRALAGQCGLEIQCEVGDYDGSAFDAERGPRWIGFLRRPQ